MGPPLLLLLSTLSLSSLSASLRRLLLLPPRPRSSSEFLLLPLNHDVSLSRFILQILFGSSALYLTDYGVALDETNRILSERFCICDKASTKEKRNVRIIIYYYYYLLPLLIFYYRIIY